MVIGDIARNKIYEFFGNRHSTSCGVLAKRKSLRRCVCKLSERHGEVVREQFLSVSDKNFRPFFKDVDKSDWTISTIKKGEIKTEITFAFWFF